MAEPKTKPTAMSVDEYLNTIEPEKMRLDCFALKTLFERASGHPPVMWGGNMVGFGTYHYKYKSGRERAWFVTGFARRKHSLVVYIMPGFSQYEDLMERLGTYKTGKSCLYISQLDDVDQGVLEELVRLSVDWMKEKYDTA